MRTCLRRYPCSKRKYYFAAVYIRHNVQLHDETKVQLMHTRNITRNVVLNAQEKEILSPENGTRSTMLKINKRNIIT